MTFAGKWMHVETVMLSEIILTQKDKYHINSPVEFILKLKQHEKGRNRIEIVGTRNQMEGKTRGVTIM